LLGTRFFYIKGNPVACINMPESCLMANGKKKKGNRNQSF